ncbi:ZINC-FINGER HOMEODOMAIN PROTEIN 8 [Salix purpurea]|uniref:ZINC-FINGER HOMEODOMAIN PROTEIN 8 n=1 Tax=Salix purpurea TaxID=77065 RepID=A0A9Q0VAI8_SALPP|nr:ZINC-FINGER HOMEODOMAIN PROTEIN 8 [Salix purpurea]
MLLPSAATPMTVVVSSCHMVMIKAPAIGSPVLPVAATATSIEDRAITNPVRDFIPCPHEDDDDEDLDDLDHDRRSETPERGEMDVMGSGGEGFKLKSAGSSNKRFRTKFTQEQKERMLEFAEKIGWRRMRKHDDMALNQFCNEIGVKRKVLQVWMHNNKNANRHRDGSPRVPADGAPPSPPPSAPPHQPVGG